MNCRVPPKIRAFPSGRWTGALIFYHAQKPNEIATGDPGFWFNSGMEPNRLLRTGIKFVTIPYRFARVTSFEAAALNFFSAVA